MKEQSEQAIVEVYSEFLSARNFPCVAAREAIARKQVKSFVAGHMACPKDDTAILSFLYKFIDEFRDADDVFHSAAIIFQLPVIECEETFERLMWQRLQALSDMDAINYKYDNRVEADPLAENFSFSLKEEAFFIVGMHPKSSRAMRRFMYPVLAFNPHVLFEKMKANGQYAKMKTIVRKRDVAYSGSVNPMLDDFGKSSEVFQYSGRQYDNQWQCPLKINHAAITNNSST